MNDVDNFEVSMEPIDDGFIVKPQGEIDLSRSPSLRTTLQQAHEAKPDRLIVDLSEVPYMDSSGVATLLISMQATSRTGGRLILCGLQERVRSILEIARLDEVFTIVENCDDATSLS